MSYIAMKQTRAENSITLWERLGGIMNDPAKHVRREDMILLMSYLQMC
ncbi:MAG: hypothetical protein LKJ83_00770 [Eubacteriaceae bacterium]|jgi:hypothetical protein|nr:hypothetical protein [Eubacteriaceae bacterium]